MNEQWKSYFPFRVRQEGYDYFLKGKVKNLKKDGDSLSAVVLGTKVYRVRIVGMNGARPSMSCTCRESAGGVLCRHMAAVLYAWEDETGIAHHEEPDEEPFPGNEPEDQFFRMSEMTDGLTILSDETKEARHLLADNLLTLADPDIYYASHGAIPVGGQVFARFRTKAGEGRVLIAFRKNVVQEVECSRCGSFYNDRVYPLYYQGSVCPHGIAAMMALDRYFRKYNPGDASDYAGIRFLKDAQKMVRALSGGKAQRDEKARTIRLVPRLTLDYSDLYLGFQVGTDKLYVAKNLQDMTEAQQKEAEYVLGKKETLRFGTETFTEDALKWYELIEREVGEAKAERERISRSYRLTEMPEEVKSRIILNGNALDTFFDLAKGEKIAAKTKNGRAIGPTVSVTDGTMKVTVTISKNKEHGRFLGIRIAAALPHLIRGSIYQYILKDDALIRLSRENIQSLKLFYDHEYLGKYEGLIGKRHLADFYYKVLPSFLENPYLNIIEEDAEEIASYLPPRVSFRYFLDRNTEEGVITCRAEAVYGNLSFVMEGPDTENAAVPVSYRDTEAEHEAVSAVGGYFSKFDPDEKIFFENDDETHLYALLGEGIPALMELGEVHVSEELKKLKVRKAQSVSVGVSVESELLDLTVQTDDMTPQELIELLQSYREKKKFYRLRSGDFMTLSENESLSMLSLMMDTLGIGLKEFTDGKMHLPLYRALYLEKMLEEHEAVASERDRHFRTLIRNFNAVRESDFEVPPSLSRVLRKYQVYGYKWLRTLSAIGFGGILADDMGLGKTLQMIAVLLAEKEERASEASGNSAALGTSGTSATTGASAGRTAAGGVSAGSTAAAGVSAGSAAAAGVSAGSVPGVSDCGMSAVQPAYTITSLIICPASLIYNWEEEFHRFAPSLRVRCVVGTAKARKEILKESSSYDVLITSYDLLKKDIEAYEDLSFRYEILDEAQYIKNQKAAAAKTVKVIRAERHFALTGTPIENRLSELWSIFDYLMPGFLFKYEAFRTRFETPVTKYKDETAAAELRKMVQPFILRRSKKDVLKDLPDKIEEIRYARFEEEQQKLYDAQVTHLREMLAGNLFEKGEEKMKILAELTKIRQICCDPALRVDHYKGGSAKREAAMELIKNAADAGHKMLVFSQFTSMLEILEQELRDEDISYYKITGATPKEERIRLVHAFNEDETPVFLISLKAGGTGLNLTGADFVIHYDPWWNLAAQNQATDRAHRIGQTKQVTVFRMIVKDSIEEKILHMQDAKKDLADAILAGEGKAITQMSKEEMMELLG